MAISFTRHVMIPECPILNYEELARSGVVTDPSGAVVPDVDVEIKDNLKSTQQVTKTDREGVYRFFFLAPSAYTLTVTHAGFRQERPAVNVLLGPPDTVNVALEIAKTSSEITVTDEVPTIQAENGDVSTTMNQKQISEVPNPESSRVRGQGDRNTRDRQQKQESH